MAELTDKVAVVTGASSGIGEAIAVLFAARGARVTLCGRNQERLQAVHQRCTKASHGKGDNFITVAGDLTQDGVRTAILQNTVEKFGRLDILVTNAGMGLPNDTYQASEELYDTIMDVNMKSVFFLCQKAIPELEKTKGNIVSVSSVVTTITPRERLVVYALSKAALDQYTKAMALTLGPKGVRVNAVNPGYIATRVVRNRCPDADDDAAVSAAAQWGVKTEDPLHPLHGRCSTTEEVAEVVAFLASPHAGLLTGHCLPVESGRRFMGHQV